MPPSKTSVKTKLWVDNLCSYTIYQTGLFFIIVIYYNRIITGRHEYEFDLVEWNTHQFQHRILFHYRRMRLLSIVPICSTYFRIQYVSVYAIITEGVAKNNFLWPMHRLRNLPKTLTVEPWRHILKHAFKNENVIWEKWALIIQFRGVCQGRAKLQLRRMGLPERGPEKINTWD